MKGDAYEEIKEQYMEMRERMIIRYPWSKKQTKSHTPKTNNDANNSIQFRCNDVSILFHNSDSFLPGMADKGKENKQHLQAEGAPGLDD